MAEFTVKEKEYRSTKLNALQQAHLMRRLLPLVSSLTGLARLAPSALTEGADGKPPMLQLSLDNARDALTPIANSLSELSDEAFDYIVALCLSSVSRKEGDRWVRIWNKGAGMPQYDDIDLPAMLVIIGNVIQDNLSGFLGDGPSPFSGLLKTGQK